ATIPFIFLTAKTNRSEIRHGMDLGADDYLTKPFFPADLYNAIESRFARQSIITQQFQKKLDELRQNITAALPHELRTPLTGILAGSALLRERYTGPENEDVYVLADLMYQSAERLNRLVQNSLLYALLAVFRSDDKALAQMRASSTTGAGSVIEATARRVANRAEREADLSVDAQSTRASILEEHFVKIVEELADNAFKYSKAGSSVQVTSFNQDHYFQLWITDSGHGMSAEQIANVGAYAQFDRKLYEQQGTGLGLVLAQQLAEIYEGELSIDSKPGGPTTVRVILPE
ncbi:MAG TPA: ATP-binding protein, partial [Anaerolineae bacterium]